MAPESLTLAIKQGVTDKLSVTRKVWEVGIIQKLKREKVGKREHEQENYACGLNLLSLGYLSLVFSGE